MPTEPASWITMKTSIKKLPTLPIRLVKKYITDMKVTEATQATSRV